MSADIYVAARNAIIHTNGRRVQVRKGVTTVRAGHPLLEGHAGLFKPLQVTHDISDVEQATAGPGEKRTTTRRSKKTDD